MSFEKPSFAEGGFVENRMNKFKDEDQEEQKSAKEIFNDPSLENIKKRILESQNKEDLAKKLLQKDELEDAEFKDLNQIAKEIKEASQNVNWMEDALGSGSIFNELASVDGDFGKWKSLIGGDLMEKVYNRDYFIELYLDDRSSFDNLKSKIEAYHKTEEKIKKESENLEEKVNKLAKTSQISLDQLRNIFDLEKSDERNARLEALVQEKFSLFFRKSKGEKFKQELEAILKEGDIFIEGIRKGKGVFGRNEKNSLKNIATTFLSDAAWKESTEKKVGEIFTNKKEDVGIKDLSFSEASSLLDNEGKNLQESWEKFKTSNTPKRFQRDATLFREYWSGLQPAALNRKRNTFFNNMKTKKGGGFWMDLVKVVSSVRLV
jgi:hypothetical protein